MNDNDDVMGFNDEPDVPGGYEPDNIPDSAYSPNESTDKPFDSQNNGNSNEYEGYEGWEAETDDINEGQNLTSNNMEVSNQSTSSTDSSSDVAESDSDDSEESQAKKLLDTKPSEKVDITQKKNKGLFLKRQKIILIITFIFVAFILFFSFVFPAITARKNKEKSKELDKNGKQYIPSSLQNEIIESPSSTDSKVDFTDGNSALVVEEDLSEKYPPLVEEKKPASNTAPVQISSSGSDTSSVPLTNRNEQQKQPQRLALEKTTSPTENEAKKTGAYYAVQKPTGYNTGYNSGYSGTNTTPTRSYTPEALGQNLEKLINTQTSYGMQSSYNQQNNQSAKQEFLNKNGLGGNYQWNSDYSLWKGTIISVVLDTGINTDLPGQVMGHVTKNVFSSQDGTYLLIPQGSRLFGEYSSDISYGQSRIQVVWNTLIRPDGLEVNLGSMNGIDAYGISGYRGWKSEHPFEYVKAFGLIAAYSILDTKAMNLIDSQGNMYAQNALTDVYSETKKLNNKIVDRALDIQPTIRIASGTEVNLITNVTIDLPPLERYEVDEKYLRY